MCRATVLKYYSCLNISRFLIAWSPHCLPLLFSEDWWASHPRGLWSWPSPLHTGLVMAGSSPPGWTSGSSLPLLRQFPGTSGLSQPCASSLHLSGTRAPLSSGLCCLSLSHSLAELLHQTSAQCESSRLTSAPAVGTTQPGRRQRMSFTQEAGEGDLYRRSAASCSQHARHPCHPPTAPPSACPPRRATWRMSDSHSLCNPPRCQVKVFEAGGDY